MANQPAEGKVEDKPVVARSAADIQKTFDKAWAMLAAAFREHLRQDKADGSIVLGFTVTPGGLVSESHLISTTFQDKVFVDFIVGQLRHMDFGAADVAVTTVAEFPIRFAAQELAPVAPAQAVPQDAPHS